MIFGILFVTKSMIVVIILGSALVLVY